MNFQNYKSIIVGLSLASVREIVAVQTTDFLREAVDKKEIEVFLDSYGKSVYALELISKSYRESTEDGADLNNLPAQFCPDSI